MAPSLQQTTEAPSLLRRMSSRMGETYQNAQRAGKQALPKRLRKKQEFVFGLLVLLSLTTMSLLVICCLYAYIAGDAKYYYNRPDSWQFCMVYADTTTTIWNQKIVDGAAPSLSYLGLMNMIYTWAGLAATFRALYHYDWIPATIVFLILNAFCQLCYYQVRGGQTVLVG